MHFLRGSTGRESVVSSTDLPALCKRFRMLLILVLFCFPLGACAVRQEDTTFREISRIESLDETLQDPDFNALAGSAGKEHGSINIENGLPPAASVEAHMGQQQAHGGFSRLEASPDDAWVSSSVNNNDNPTQVEGAGRKLFDEISIDAKGSRLVYEYVLTTLISIDLSYNLLSGRLPYALGALRGLTYLNLAHNNFSGEIPQVFGDLLGLESLDLSANYHTGKIPAMLTTISSLGYLNLSYNFLEGEIPTANAFSTRYDISSFKPGNDQLCGAPLETTCVVQNSNASVSSATLGAPWSELQDGTFWRAFEIGTAIGVVIVLGTLSTIPFTRRWLLHPQNSARRFKEGRYGVFNEPT
ncbi:hypothetical protein AXG93_2269s1240 [Marchantia polymorpha subsp. ruderalis]|uniref:Leucine-rich repeat-containing N-terminal plant-type domain-containing protein n=1 Tax=Marchantia polymorpha subsp. ruderalis TaxID=1480154 RepID=A0A176VK32_MARPO|nr:hypothetical protein AXG93_2269s1240 [Marchantia polymorpha subsp. ruderalis]